MTLVAIIEHDPVFATELRAAVESAGLQTDWFTRGMPALDSARHHAFALAILDLDIPDIDPFAAIDEVSQLIPIIAVIAERDEEACLLAFEAGADDCMTRPFTVREMSARIRNVLRRAGTIEAGDDFALAISEMRVRSGGVTRALSRGEAEILAILAGARGHPLTVHDLLERLPAQSRVKRGTVESRIKSLRRKLGPGRLITRGRLGYELSQK